MILAALKEPDFVKSSTVSIVHFINKVLTALVRTRLVNN